MKTALGSDHLARQLELPLASPPRGEVRSRRRGHAEAKGRARREAPAGGRPPERASRSGGRRVGSPWRLDERTCRIGLEGVAAARALLAERQPCPSLDATSGAAWTGPGRAA